MDLDTAIIGAGPYGLSIAAHLRAAGLPFEIFGTALESWKRFMPEGMVLKSERFASTLWDPQRAYTLQRYCKTKGIPYQAVGSPLSLALFLEYADWFRQNTIGEFHDVKVRSIRRVARGFGLDLSDGRALTSRRVVLATGHMPFRMIPGELAHLPEPQVLHSTRLGRVTDYVGRDIVIIGAGQSALETGALLHEAGARVRILARRNRIVWNARSKPRPVLQRIVTPDAGIASGWNALAVSELPRLFRWYFPPGKRHGFVADSYGPSGAWWLRDRVDGQIELRLGAQLGTATLINHGVTATIATGIETEEITADHIVAATGFRVDIDRLDYLDPELRRSIHREASGIPILSSHFETSVPELFIVGVASSPVFGPIMRFIYGAKHVSPALVSRLRLRVN